MFLLSEQAPPAFFENAIRDQPPGRSDQGGDDYRIVKVPKDRDEVRDEVEWQQRVADGQAEQPPGKLGRSRVLEGAPVYADLQREAANEFLESDLVPRLKRVASHVVSPGIAPRPGRSWLIGMRPQ